MKILLTNDDGIYAPGLAAMERYLRQLGSVTIVAPATEQSGVGHSITFLNPLVCTEIFHAERRRGWSVEGSPADCVKIGIMELCEERPDLIVSGINGGLNAGINVLYSGTVAAAIEGAFFGITSVAVSLEYDEHADFDRAAEISGHIIQQLLTHRPPAGGLFNLNLPTQATRGPSQLKVVPMGVARYGEHFLKRRDPRGRIYYWATNDPPPKPTDHETDLTALARGHVTLTPLDFDLTRHDLVEPLQGWELTLPD